MFFFRNEFLPLKADYKVLKREKHFETFLYKTVFKRALFTTKSEFLMRDRALHISHNAAALS